MNEKPNVILITLDCLRADYCGWLNPNKKELTPFLNKLAQESFVFTQAYATGPRTSLSFPGILTGTYPLSFNGWDKKNFPGLEQRPYLPEILYNNEYFTIAVHDNPYLSAFFGYDRGFDIFKGPAERSERQFFDIKEKKGKLILFYFCIKWCFQKLNRYKWYRHFRTFFFKKFPKIYNFLKIILILIGTRKPKKLLPVTPAQIINKFVLEEMRFSQDPWFLWIHYMEPHEPYYPPKKMLPSNISKRDLEKANIQYRNSMSYQNLKEENFELIKKLYQFNIKYLDQQISQLFGKLKDKIRNSIIVITADHGQEFGEHGVVGHTSKKTDSRLYKEVLHVPLMIIIPGKDTRIINDIVSSVQIPATILEIIGIKSPSEMQPSLFSGNKIKVFSETLLECSPLWDKFNLSSRQEVVFKD